MRLRCVSTIEPYWWNVGKQYEVEKSTDDLFILKDETGYVWNEWLILDFLNGKAHCKMEVVEEEKEMTKYVEVTKLIDWSRDPELLEVGKVYKVEEEYKDMLYIKGVSIYVNQEEESYYLRSDQFKFVDGPVADIKVDVKEAIQAKIDELRTEAEHLFTKRNRLEQHRINLNKKAQKLKEVLETIKEFE